jgi:hypothetical protein
MIQRVAEQVSKDHPDISKNVQAHTSDSYAPNADRVLFFIGMHFSLPTACDRPLSLNQDMIFENPSLPSLMYV